MNPKTKRRKPKANPTGLTLKIAELQARLAEAEETLDAIRSGAVDALVVSGLEGEQVFALKGAERPYRLLVEAMQEAALMLNEDGTILYCNGRLADMTRCARDFPIGQRLTDFVVPEQRIELERFLRGVPPEGGKGEFWLRWKLDAGNPLPVKLAVRPLQLEGTSALAVVATDLTTQKAYEAMLYQSKEQLEHLVKARTTELRDQREYFRVTLTSIGDAVIAFDTAARLTFINPVAAALTGWNAEQAAGQPTSAIFRIINEKTRQPAEDIVARVLTEKRPSGLANNTALLSRDGREIPVEDSAAPILSAAGELTGVVVVFREVTEKRRAQEALREAKETLSQANTALERKVQERTVKLAQMIEELEHFSYTITHDMRAPLRAMQGFASLMNEMCAKCRKRSGKEYLDLIKTSAARMDHLITDALQYTKSGKQQMPLGPVDAAALLQDIIRSYPSMQPPKARIQVDGAIPRVLGNDAGLTQCFANLLSNAVKFVPADTVPTVRIHSEPREGYVRLWFEDNGLGVPETARARLFQLFQRAHTGFEGTGLGLALARKVTEQMGGRIGLDPAAAHGSRFWVDLRPAD